MDDRSDSIIDETVWLTMSVICEGEGRPGSACEFEASYAVSGDCGCVDLLCAGCTALSMEHVDYMVFRGGQGRCSCGKRLDPATIKPRKL